MRTFALADFMLFPELAFRLGLVRPFRWSGSPPASDHLATRALFVLGAANLVYQNVGMLIHLLGTHPQSQSQSQPADGVAFVLQLSETGSILGLTLVAACKMLLLFWYGDRIARLIEEFAAIFPGAEVQRAQASGRRLAMGTYPVAVHAHSSHRLMKLTAAFFMFAFCFYNLVPLAALAIEVRAPELSFSYRYQSNTWYPWQTGRNADSAPLFLLAYLCQLQSSLTGVAFIMAGEFMLCFFITQMRLHFDFLASALEGLDASGPRAPQQLRALIDYHNTLLRFSGEINEIFNISFLVNFVTSTVAICLMGFSMVALGSSLNTFKFSVGLLSFLVFTLFICYNGSEFTTASDRLMYAALYNNWYDGSPAYRKMILFFVMRSVRPSVLTAYKFTTVSMQAYMAILKSSYRLFTFFRTMG